MQRSRKPTYWWSLAIATALTVILHVSEDARSQTPALTVSFASHRSQESGRSTDAPLQIAEHIAVPSSGSGNLTGASMPTAVQIIDRPGNQSLVSPPQPSWAKDTTSAVVDATEVSNATLIESRSVACRAASQWTPAKQLRQHASATQELYCDGDEATQKAANAIARFLHQQADHQQDIAAAIALRAYYAHSAIDEQFKLARQSAAALAEERKRQLAIVEKGFAAAIDLTTLDREAINQQLQYLQLEQRDRQVMESLNDAMQINYDWQASQTEPLEVRIQSIDTDYLVQFALSHRHDLLAIQCLGTQINADTAPLLGSVVSSASGMINLPLPKRCFVARLLKREDNTALANHLKVAVALAYETQSNAIRREVSEKSLELELAYKRITLSQETTASWNKRVNQLDRLTELGDSRPADQTLARSSLLSSQAIEVERRLEAKLLEIDLAEACGGLYCRCCTGQAWLITSR